MLKGIFIELCGKYNSKISLAEDLWTEIEKAYSNKKRVYHNLEHLENLIVCLQEVRNQIRNWDAVIFSVFYHDIIYNPVKKDNEEQSAALGAKGLQTIGISEEIIRDCREQILATKDHQVHHHTDVNIFTDADLSILGADWETYHFYAGKIRKEYRIFPDIIYKPGRKKVLQHFLSMKRIYKTHYFFERLEEKAKQNLTKELELLS